MSYVLVFVSAFAIDWVWVFYTRAIVAHRPIEAGFYAGWLVGLSLFNAYSAVHDLWCVPFAMLGASYGTYLATRTGANDAEVQS